MFQSLIQQIQIFGLRAHAEIARPLRKRRMEAMAIRGEAPMSVLFYHRVADVAPNAWTISVAAFERHVQFIRSNFELIQLDELQRRVRERDSYRPSVTFTFDDGYADNCRHALPLLIRHRIPCVYFVSVENVRDSLPFSHDIEAGQPLAVNSVEELRAAADGGIEIGLHTYSHFDFSKFHDERTIHREIGEAKNELERLVGRTVRYFAFPFGMPRQLQPCVIRAVHDAGMLGFCSAFGGYNLVDRDDFHIRRIHGDPEFARLMNWLSFDRRKVRREPNIPYDLNAALSTDVLSSRLFTATS